MNIHDMVGKTTYVPVGDGLWMPMLITGLDVTQFSGKYHALEAKVTMVQMGSPVSEPAGPREVEG